MINVVPTATVSAVIARLGSRLPSSQSVVPSPERLDGRISHSRSPPHPGSEHLESERGRALPGHEQPCAEQQRKDE